MSKQPPPAPTASAVDPCPTIIQIEIVGRPGTGSLPRTFAPPDHPLDLNKKDRLSYAKSVEPDLTPRIAASDLGLHCLPMSFYESESLNELLFSCRCIGVAVERGNTVISFLNTTC